MWHQTFLKTDQYLSYINLNSNHPKAIIKQVPKAVDMRIRRWSANEKIFKDSSKIYKEALKNIGLRRVYLLPWRKNTEWKEFVYWWRKYEVQSKNRKRKIIWFNHPTFCRPVSINVRKYFLKFYMKYLIGKR